MATAVSAMMSSLLARRLAALSPVAVVALAFAWPIIVVIGGVAYALTQISREMPSGTMMSIGFSFGHPPISEAWPGHVILFLPPLLLVSTWWYLRRHRGASIE